jgi:hypothetical protein
MCKKTPPEETAGQGLEIEGWVKQPSRKSCQNRKPINVTAVTERWVCRHMLFPDGDVGDDAVTILDYVAIGLLAVCLMLWATNVLLAPKSSLGRGSGQDATERQGRE